jgi:AcrR family transcriptional regulator
VTGQAGSASSRVREVTRARVLSAAEAVFLERGFAATSVEVVAEQAGFTTGAIYSNFGGKADLFLAVLEQTTAVELAGLRVALEQATTDEQRLTLLTSPIVTDPARWQARVAATLEFLSYARQHPELHERMRAAQRLADEATGELLTAMCTALGVDPPASVDELTRDVMALINGLAIRSLFDDDLDIARAVSTGISSLLTGQRSDLRALPTGAKRAR